MVDKKKYDGWIPLLLDYFKDKSLRADSYFGGFKIPLIIGRISEIIEEHDSQQAEIAELKRERDKYKKLLKDIIRTLKLTGHSVKKLEKALEDGE